MMSSEYAERIRAWHESAYESLREREATDVSYLGRRFVVPPQVFPPAPMSELLGNAVLQEVQGSDRVLDMGTGCGVNAILAAAQSADVVGVDINPYAIAAAQKNADINGVASRIKFYESDVFKRVDGNFDLIVFDPPFRWFAPRDELEAAIADENYGALTRFMGEVRSRLRIGGRMLLFFGSSGDLDYLHSLIGMSGFDKEVVSERALDKDDWTVRYYVFRLTVP